MRVIRPLLFLLLIIVIYPAYSQSHCDSKIEYFVKGGSASGSVIALKASQGLKAAELELYDLYLGKVVQQKKISNGLLVKQDVFTGVKPSVYVIYVKQEGCDKRSVGGLDGIKIENIER